MPTDDYEDYDPDEEEDWQRQFREAAEVSRHPKWQGPAKIRKITLEDLWEAEENTLTSINPEEKKEETPKSVKEILAPLDEVFLEDRLKDEIILRTGITDLLAGETPKYNGVVLTGPAGTGKTSILNSLCQVYENAGAYVSKISFSEIESPYIGVTAQKLDEIIQETIVMAEEIGKPSFLALDEAGTITQRAALGAETVAKHYQEIIDVLKRYVGNDRSFVIGITTNSFPQNFEDALIREGRLTVLTVDYPNEEQRKKMWRHFAGKYGIFSLSEEQASELAKVTKAEQGAYIEEFSRSYLIEIKGKLIKARGYSSIVEGLKEGVSISEREAREAISYEQLKADITESLKAKYTRTYGEKNKGRIGFSAGRQNGIQA